jgi:hypothetical protein
MNTTSLNLPFVELVKDAANDRPWMTANFDKVAGVLKGYAERRDLTLGKLTLIHICHDRDRAELNLSLSAFIDRLLQSKSYKSEIRSRLHRILTGLTTPPGRADMTPGPQPLPTPEVLRKLLPSLPRQTSFGHAGKLPARCSDEERRLACPLTERGQQALAILIQVVEKYGITDLDTLFYKHIEEVKRTIRVTLPTQVWRGLNCCVMKAFKRIGYGTVRTPKGRVDYHEWPPTLREQFDRLKELAPFGIDHDQELTDLAAEYDLEVAPLRNSTVRDYEGALSIGLFHILSRLDNKPADMDVLDLLRLQKGPLKGKGKRGPIYLNPFVELYRRRELERISRATNSRIATTSFRFFLYAIRAVALYNGHFESYSGFNKVYKPKLDMKQRRAKKKAKKDTFDLTWIDNEIERMLEEYQRILKERSFRLDGRGKTSSRPQDRYRDMRFCLFFVILVTLRHMGHRQQSLRNCEVGRGKNIEFLDDGSIHFNWKSELVKTDVELDQVIDEWEHQSHKIMREVLTSYYQIIYRPYILKNCAIGPDGQNLVANQLFVCLDSAGKFRRFIADKTRDFGGRFTQWSLEFMEYGGRANTLGRGVHPHFFRGLAVDWVVNVKKVPLEKAAEYFGISVKTLVRDYLQEDPIKSAAGALSAANAKDNAKAAQEREDALKREKSDMEASFKEALDYKDKLLEEKDQRIYKLEEELIEALKKNRAA